MSWIEHIESDDVEWLKTFQPSVIFDGVLEEMVSHSAIKMLTYLIGRSDISILRVLNVIVTQMPYKEKQGALSLLARTLMGQLKLSTADKESIMTSAVRRNCPNMLKILLEDSTFDFNCCNGFAIGLSSDYGYVETVDLLLKSGRCDPSIDDNYAYRAAVKNRRVDVVKLLMTDRRVSDLARETELANLRNENAELKQIIAQLRALIE